MTPTPIDRFGREQSEIAKTSLGAAKTLPWEHLDNEEYVELVRKLKSEGVKVVAVEQTSRSIDIDEFSVPQSVAYIFGNEIDGVNLSLLQDSDQLVEIPMKGEKQSLNVSVTAGIVLFKNA